MSIPRVTVGGASVEIMPVGVRKKIILQNVGAADAFIERGSDAVINQGLLLSPGDKVILERIGNDINLNFNAISSGSTEIQADEY